MSISATQLTVPAPRGSGRGTLGAGELARLGGALVVHLADGEPDDEVLAPSAVEQELDGPELARAKLVRAAGWWQLDPHLVEGWGRAPQTSPRLLIAVVGPARRLRVWASIEIDRTGWEATERHDQGLYLVPTVPLCCATVPDARIVPVHPIRVTLSTVDAAALGDRLLASGEIGAVGGEGERWFGPARSQRFVVIPPRA